MSKVTRHNWREYCEESELTDEERGRLSALTSAIRREVLGVEGHTELLDFIIAHSEDAQDAYIERELPRTYDGMPAYIDIVRRRDRAELAAWREWEDKEAHDD